MAHKFSCSASWEPGHSCDCGGDSGHINGCWGDPCTCSMILTEERQLREYGCDWEGNPVEDIWDWGRS
jgi:hypothetical protein